MPFVSKIVFKSTTFMYRVDISERSTFVTVSTFVSFFFFFFFLRDVDELFYVDVQYGVPFVSKIVFKSTSMFQVDVRYF